MAIYLKFVGDKPVHGGVTVPGYGGWFEALSYQAATAATSQRRQPRSVPGFELDVALALDTYSLLLLCSGTDYQKVVLHVLSGGKMPKLVLEIVMTGVYLSESGRSDKQMTLALLPNQVSMHYFRYDPVTGKEMPMQAGYDIKQVVAQ